MIMQRYQDYVSAEHGMIRRVSKLMAFDINIMPEGGIRMGVQIVYTSRTGNTEKLAEAVLRQCR